MQAGNSNSCPQTLAIEKPDVLRAKCKRKDILLSPAEVISERHFVGLNCCNQAGSPRTFEDFAAHWEFTGTGLGIHGAQVQQLCPHPAALSSPTPPKQVGFLSLLHKMGRKYPPLTILLFPHLFLLGYCSTHWKQNTAVRGTCCYQVFPGGSWGPTKHRTNNQWLFWEMRRRNK